MIKKIISIAMVVCCLLNTTMSNATIINGTGGNAGGPGGPGSTGCTVSFDVTCTNSTISVSGNTTVCAPNYVSGTGATSMWKISNTTSTPILCRVLYVISKSGTMGTGTAGGSFTVANNSSNVIYSDAVSGFGSLMPTTGNYISTPTLQWYCSSNSTWYSTISGSASTAVGIVINPANSLNSFTLNGKPNNGIIIQCPSSLQPLTMQGISTGAISNYKIVVEKSTDGLTYTNANTYTTLFTTATSVPYSINLHTLCGTTFLPFAYSGYLRVSLYVTANGQCDNGLFIKTQLFQIQNIAVQADFYAFRYPNTAQNIIDNKKIIQTTLPINSTMPSGSTMLLFKDNLNLASGWQGASSAGIGGITANGPWAIKVYEVDGTTGIRMTQVIAGITYTAPDIVYTSGTSVNSSYFQFSTYCKTFNSVSNTNFYVDPTSNFGDGDVFFKSYYEWAKAQGTAALTTFSAKTWCAELSVTNNSCTVINKGYFRIASAFNLPLGSNARYSNSLEDIPQLNVYPNPTQGIFDINIPQELLGSSISLFDNFGRCVRKMDNLNERKIHIDISDLANGLYIYKLIGADETYSGKIIKQ